ncbi:adhesion protein [Salmonella enterica subsp. enterica serovar Poona]|nr:adhesion protein [Salmonella enterica subsp. enterica serovar Poona]
MMTGFVSTSAFAQVEDSHCDATGTFSVKNFNLKAGSFGVGQELQSVSIPVSYTCYLAPKSYGPDYAATLSINPQFQSVITALGGAGLGMDLIMQEGSQAPVTFKWQEMRDAITGGASVTKTFGEKLALVPGNAYPQIHNLKGRLTLRLFVESAYVANKFVSISVPGVAVFNVLAYNPNGLKFKPGNPIALTPFNIRFIPDNSGRIIIAPSVIQLGHFYTEYKDSQEKTKPFTVTAQQAVGAGRPFETPLSIEFKTNGLTLTDADKAVALRNTDGQLNGLKLSLVDDADTPVTFNSETSMGNITMGYESTGKIVKQYTARVSPISGETVKTGSFTAAMTVVVTYN